MTGEERERHRAEVAEARPGWYWWVVMILTVATFAGGSIFVSSRSQRRSEQALCEVIVLSDDVYRSNPNPSVTVQKLAAAMGRLRAKYHC